MRLSYFNLPYFLSDWPYARKLNPHGLQVSEASSEWMVSYDLLNEKSQRAFTLYNSGLLASLAYPYATKAQLRVVCDALNVVLLFDDHSDSLTPCDIRLLAKNIMGALRNPHDPSPKSNDALEEISRDFWSRALETISPSCAHRFVEAFDQYSQAIVQEAVDRSQNYVRDMNSYLSLRRETIGAKLAFALLEDGFDFPGGVLQHPTVLELTNAAVDIISLSNDAYSYNVEQARGDDAHNIVTCIMREQNLELDEAMVALEELVASLAQKFLVLKGRVPKWTNEIDEHLAAYIDGMGIWVRANDVWSFESQRYFGEEGIRIQKHRMVMLHPKRAAPSRGILHTQHSEAGEHNGPFLITTSLN